jgi:ribonuclease HII
MKRSSSRKNALLAIGQHALSGEEPMLAFEREARALGFLRVAGVDEAGRGPLAGPIVAAAVILSGPVAGINDSKQLTSAQRESYYEILIQGGHAIGRAIIPAAEIDRQGIQRSNYQAMAEAIRGLHPAPDYLLIDGYSVPGLAQPQRKIIKGDSLSQSIAAASVIAKVIRDRLMVEYDEAYPQYGFARHKGYGTQAHLDAIAAYGPCPIHRMSFAPLSRPRETGSLFD